MTPKKNSIEDLIKAIFLQAEKRTGKPDSKNAMADHISKWLLDNRKFNVSSKTLIRQYERYVLKWEGAQKNPPPTVSHQDEYASYIGYDNYNDFVLTTNKHLLGGEKTGPASLSEKISGGVTNIDSRRVIHAEKYEEIGKKEETTVHGDYIVGDPESKKRNKWVLIIVLFIAIIVSVTLWIINSKNSEKLCLFWKGNRFESAVCTDVPEDQKELTISPEEWQDNYKTFRKIQPSSSTRFFDSNGNPAVWYQYKNGQYEFFNQSGKHPVNGKKLIPVNPKVIEAYFKSIEEPDETVKISAFEEPFVLTEKTESEGEKSSQIENEESAVKKGKYCFKNQSSKKMVTYIQASGHANQRVDLEANEQVCVLLPINNYSYSTFVSGQSGAIKQGKFTVSENKEGYISLSIPMKEETAKEPETIPESKPTKDCSKGDFCVKNTTSETLTFRLAHKSGAQFGQTTYTNLTIHGGKTECFYDIPAEVYSVEYNFGVLTVTNMQHTNIRVVGCETREKVF